MYDYSVFTGDLRDNYANGVLYFFFYVNFNLSQAST